MNGGRDGSGPAAPALIDIHNATVRREGNTIFRGFGLRIEQGQSTALLGPNGAGKTTLLRLLTRELYPVVRDDSHVRILGKERFSVWDLRRDIGIVSHELQHAFVRGLPGLEVVLSGFAASIGLRGVGFDPGANDRAAAAAVMRRLGVGELAAVRFDRMSTGQQRRVLLARALVHEPDALVLDEPAAGLDMKMAHGLVDILRELMRAGRTIVLATHNVAEIPPEIEHVVMLKDCRVFRDGDKARVLNAATLSELYDTPLRVVREHGYYLPLPVSRHD